MGLEVGGQTFIKQQQSAQLTHNRPTLEDGYSPKETAKTCLRYITQKQTRESALILRFVLNVFL